MTSSAVAARPPATMPSRGVITSSTRVSARVNTPSSMSRWATPRSGSSGRGVATRACRPRSNQASSHSSGAKGARVRRARGGAAPASPGARRGGGAGAAGPGPRQKPPPPPPAPRPPPPGACPPARPPPPATPRPSSPVVPPALGGVGADIHVAQERAVGLRQRERDDVRQRAAPKYAAVEPPHGWRAEQRELDPRAAGALPRQDPPRGALKPSPRAARSP